MTASTMHTMNNITYPKCAGLAVFFLNDQLMLKRNWEPKLSMKHKYVHIIHDRMYKWRNAECKYSKIKQFYILCTVFFICYYLCCDPLSPEKELLSVSYYIYCVTTKNGLKS